MSAQGNEAEAVLEFLAAGSVLEQAGPSLTPRLRLAQTRGDERRGDVGRERVQNLTSPTGTSARMAEESIFRREGDFWLLMFEGQTAHLRDQKGLHYLARLLAEPGREFHVVDLVVGDRAESRSASRAATPDLRGPRGADAAQLLDAPARVSYRRRLVEIESDIEDAREMGDSERAAQADSERDFIVRELAGAVGLGGRNRRASSASERARVGVTQAVRHALARIRVYNLPLGEHLDRAIRTGPTVRTCPTLGCTEVGTSDKCDGSSSKEEEPRATV